MDEQLVESAMQIIMQSGNARTVCMKALDAVAQADFVRARELLAEADSTILQAHHVHTTVLQEAMRAEHVEYSLLFAHAQDTLMTISSEINVAKKLCCIFSAYLERGILQAHTDELEELA